MNRDITIVKLLLLTWYLGVVACSSVPIAKDLEEQPPELSVKLVLEVLSKQLSQPYSIYKHRRRFRADSNRQQLIKMHYIQNLSVDSQYGYIHYSQTQSNGFDYIDVKPAQYMPSVPVYALNQIGFAFADGERIIESVTSITEDVVSFQLRLLPGPILTSRGFTDSSKIYNGRARLEYNREEQQYEIIAFEQVSGIKQQWRKLGFEVEHHGEKTVFFIDPDTEILYKFLSTYDAKSEVFKAMQAFQKYIKPITIQ